MKKLSFMPHLNNSELGTTAKINSHKSSEHLYIMRTILIIGKVENMTKNNLNQFLKCMVRLKNDVLRCLTPLKRYTVRVDII